MAKASTADLAPSPFTTHRDPKTGRWIVSHNSNLEPPQDDRRKLEIVDNLASLLSPSSC